MVFGGGGSAIVETTLIPFENLLQYAIHHILWSDSPCNKIQRNKTKWKLICYGAVL